MIVSNAKNDIGCGLKDADINGWEITIDHFTSAKSDDLDERNIAVEAWNGSVDEGDEVFIEVSHWLDIKNGMGIKNVEWQDEGQCAPLVKAVPDHYWRIGPALPEPQNPGTYKHLFTMVNSDPSTNSGCLRPPESGSPSSI